MSSFNDEDREIIVEFVAESNEALEQTEQDLLKLEDFLTAEKDIDPAIIDTIFRTFHSIKGSAGFIGLNLTNSLTHHAETLLDLIRKNKIEFEKKYIDIFLEVCDILQSLLDQIQSSFNEEGFEDSVSDLQDRLKACYTTKTKESEDSQQKQNVNSSVSEKKTEDQEEHALQANRNSLITPEMVEDFIVESKELLDQLEEDLLALEENPEKKELIESAFRSLHSLKGNAGLYNYSDINTLSHKAETFFDLVRQEKVIANTKQISVVLQLLDFFRDALENLRNGNDPIIPGKNGLIDLMSEVLLSDLPVSEPELQSQAESTLPEPETKKESKDKPASKIPSQKPESKNTPTKKVDTEVIRVDVNKLNKLMDLVGEIVITESMVVQNFSQLGVEIEDFEKTIGYLQKNIRELQELATSMRMIPLSGLFSKMRRLVRDISAKKNNKVDLVIEGGETEVDRSVIEQINDPLVHILRNAIDHGIEMPEEREKAGKNPVGKILLSAKRVGGEIWVIVQDDGSGLKKDKIRARAIERGLLPDEDTEWSDQEIFNMIFKPGFSTAEKVTNLSGRGVGMDVVSRNIEKIRGRVEVASIEGKGTTIYLKIPLTTAIVDGMLIRVGHSIYAIPTLDILETLQIGQDNVLSLMDGQEVIRVREKLYPVIRLQELHRLGGDTKPVDQGIIVLTETGNTSVGFFADEILGQQQLVIKGLPKYLGKLDGVSGCAVLGNGDICLILDLSMLVKLAENSFESNYNLSLKEEVYGIS